MLTGTFISSINNNLSNYTGPKCKHEPDIISIVEEYIFRNNDLLNIIYNITVFIMSAITPQLVNTFIIVDADTFKIGYESQDFQRLTIDKITNILTQKKIVVNNDLLYMMTETIYNNHKYIFLTENNDRDLTTIIYKIADLNIITYS